MSREIEREGTMFISFLWKKLGFTNFSNIMLKICFPKMVLTVVNSVHRNLKILELNTSILNFFAEITNFLVTMKILQSNKALLLIYKNLETTNCLVHSRKLLMTSVKPLISLLGTHCTL